jgi:glycosyltransferase involved in cell wall biosynthesis
VQRGAPTSSATPSGDAGSRSVLVITRDQVGPLMAGPGIRATELARVLSERHRVRLAAPQGSAAVDPRLDFVPYDVRRPATLRPALREAQVVISQPLPLTMARMIPGDGRRWIVDLYAPDPFERLESPDAGSRLEQRLWDAARIDRVLFAVDTATALVCASERQRDMWLGFLAARGRITSEGYASDPDGRNLIDVVPFGVPDEPPKAGTPLLRGGTFPQDSRILLWGGGLWDWLDPLTVLRSLALLRERDDRWRCAFIGTERPMWGSGFKMSARAAELARELGLTSDGAVEFIDWIRYAKRGGPLLEADVAVCAHFNTMETRFAFRTRLLDAVWAGLPIVSTIGDVWSELVTARRLGASVAPEDPNAFAEAIAAVAENGKASYADALRSMAEELRWSRVAAPLLRMVDRTDELPPTRVPARARFLSARQHAAERVAREWKRLRSDS